MYRFLSMFLNASIEVILLIIQSLERICTQNDRGRVCLYSNGAIGKRVFCSPEVLYK